MGGMAPERSAATAVVIGNMGIFQVMWKKKEIIPLIVFTVFAGSMSIVSLYHAGKKQDVVFNKTGNPEPWESVNPNHPQKFVTINQQWKPIDELEKVRKMTK